MRKFIQHTILSSIILLIAPNLKAQQLPQYSQYLFNLYAINPAYAGSQEHWEAVSNFRYQWVGFTDAPRTFTISAQGPLKNRKMGLGGTFYTDIVGPTRRVGAQVSYTYHFNLSEKVKLGLGLSIGFNQWLMDGSKITTYHQGDQLFNGGLIRSFKPDAKFGFWLHGENWYFGASAPQLFHNKLEFFDDQTSKLNILEDHYFFNGAYTFKIKEDWKLEPSFMLKLGLPAPVKFDIVLRAMWRDMIWLGVGYRTNDAAMVMLGFDWKQWIGFGYSYDITTSKLRNYSNGTHEIMFHVKFAKQKKPKAKAQLD